MPVAGTLRSINCPWARDTLYLAASEPVLFVQGLSRWKARVAFACQNKSNRVSVALEIPCRFRVKKQPLVPGHAGLCQALSPCYCAGTVALKSPNRFRVSDRVSTRWKSRVDFALQEQPLGAGQAVIDSL